MERWQDEKIACAGGLVLSEDTLSQGTNAQGTAKVLQNMEPSLDGGYQRVLGYAAFDANTVPGTGPILGVGVALDGVFATRLNGADNQIFFSSGGGWGSALNTVSRPGSIVKTRFTTYSITKPVIVQTDGDNPAWHYDGTTETLINGTGAPTAPKFAVQFRNRLMLAPASNTSSVAISAANQDTVFDGVQGAIEINVGDIVTGLALFRDTPYIFCRNSIFKIVGSTSADFAVVDVSTDIGCVDGDTIQEVGGDIIFLAPDGIRSVAGTERIGDVELGLYSGAIQPLIRDTVPFFNEGKWASVYIREKNQYRTFYQDATANDASQKGFLGTFRSPGYEWATLLGFPVYSAAASYDGTNEVVVFGHPDNGIVYSMESGNSLNGGDIQYEYWSPNLTFGNAKIRKVLHDVTLYGEISGGASFSLSLVYDRGAEGVVQPAPFEFTVGGAIGVYGTAVYGTSLYSVNASLTEEVPVEGSGKVVQFRISGASSTDAAIRIEDIEIQYAPKGRR